MAQAPLDGLILFFVIWFLLALVGGCVAAVLWLVDGGASQPLFGPQRVRSAPWRLMDGALVVLVFLGLDYVGGELFGLRDSDPVLAAAVCGEIHAEALLGWPGGGFSPGPPLSRAWAAYFLDMADQARRQIWSMTVIRPVQFASLLLLFTVVSGGRLYQLGLTSHRWRRVVVAAWLVWLVITPLAKVLFWLVLQVEKPSVHPVETVLLHGGTGETWLLALFTVLIAAPLLEELLFRGFLQQVMVNSPELADLTLLATLVGIIVSGTTQVWEEGALRNAWPILLLIGTGSGYLAFERLLRPWVPQPGAARAIYATSLVFALLHVSSWPTPVPLFFLSLGLGYLGYRTQSLIGPVVAHSLFNLTTLLELAASRF